jgi:hypothetical protein
MIFSLSCFERNGFYIMLNVAAQRALSDPAAFIVQFASLSGQYA